MSTFFHTQKCRNQVIMKTVSSLIPARVIVTMRDDCGRGTKQSQYEKLSVKYTLIK